MTFIYEIINAIREPKAEPALARALVVAVVALVASFGLVLTDNQSEAIVTLAVVVVSLIQGKSTREHVMPYNWEDYDYQGDTHEDLDVSDGDELPPDRDDVL